MNIQHRYYNCILLLLICLRSGYLFYGYQAEYKLASTYESAGYDMGKDY